MNLTVCVMTFPPYLYLKNTDKGVVIKGIFADLLFFMAKYSNFTYILRNVSNKIGVKKNSTFMEVITMTGKGECDLLPFPLGVTYELGEIIDFTTPMMFPRIIIFTSPGHEEANRAIAWDLISDSPWLIGSLFLSMTVFAILFYVIERKIWKTYSFRNSLGYVFWSFYGSLFLEPFRNIPKSLSSRMLMAIWLFSVVILLSLVGGNLKANIATGERNIIDSLDDLLSRPRMKPLIVKGMPYANLIKISENKKLSTLYKRSLKMGGVIPWMDFIMSSPLKTDFFDGKTALVVLELTARIFPIVAGHCQRNGKGMFYVSKNELFSITYSVLQRKGLPADLRETINRKIAYFATTQQYVPSHRQTDLDYAHCLWKPQSEHHSSSDVVLICSVWVIGMLTATFTLIVEIYFGKCLKK